MAAKETIFCQTLPDAKKGLVDAVLPVLGRGKTASLAGLIQEFGNQCKSEVDRLSDGQGAQALAENGFELKVQFVPKRFNCGHK